MQETIEQRTRNNRGKQSSWVAKPSSNEADSPAAKICLISSEFRLNKIISLSDVEVVAWNAMKNQRTPKESCDLRALLETHRGLISVQEQPRGDIDL